MNKIETFILNNGVEMPSIGLGTYSMNGMTLTLTTAKAVWLGYNHFDTASAYDNENFLGYGVKLSCVRREQIFITTKVDNNQQRQGDIRAALYKSLKKLHLDYVDLYLIHWPIDDIYLETWKQMELVYRDGYARAIGVCNCHEHHLKKLMNESAIVPAVNQIEIHPLLAQKNLIEFCRKNKIQPCAYSPLARMHERLIRNDVLIAIARRHHKTVMQIILKWNLQNGVIPLPKTRHFQRLKENLDVFDFVLSEVEIESINKLDCNFRVRHNPDNCIYTKV